MPLTLDILDGTYEVRSQAQAGPRLIPNGDGETVIANGMTFRKDDHGLIWESTFTIIDENSVEMVSTVDPSHAAEDTFVIDDKGNPTKGMVTYKSMLTATTEDDRLVLRGEIHHGGSVTALAMFKTA